MRSFLTGLLTLLMVFCLLAANSASASSSKLTITGIADNGDGTVTITWDDPQGNGPYEVGWLENTSGSYLRDALTNTVWYLHEQVEGTSVRCSDLLPGTSYWVYVEDSTGMRGLMQCDRPEAQPFSGPDMTVVFKPRMQQDGNLSAFTVWSAAAIEHAPKGTEYGMRLELTHGYMPQERAYLLQVALSNPLGETDMILGGDFITGGRYGSKTTFYNFCGFGWYFESLIAVYGKVPQGTYTLHLYLDGGHVADCSFEMLE